jgi:hypothetical protein
VGVRADDDYQGTHAPIYQPLDSPVFDALTAVTLLASVALFAGIAPPAIGARKKLVAAILVAAGADLTRMCHFHSPNLPAASLADKSTSHVGKSRHGASDHAN